MDDFRLADPEYVDFKPKTVGHAILRFRRLQARGLKQWKYPEAMIECAASLPEPELGKFQDWCINPSGEPDADAIGVSGLTETLHQQHLGIASAQMMNVVEEEEDEKMDPHNHVQ